MRLGTILPAAVLFTLSLTATMRADDANCGGLITEPETYSCAAPSAAPRPQEDDPPIALPEVACCNPRWTVTADAMFLWRVTPDQPLLLAQPSGAGLLDASCLQSRAAVAPRLSLIYHGDSDWDLESNCFGIDGWKATCNFPAPSSAGPTLYYLLNVDGTGGPNVTTAQFDYRSQFYSAELNLRRRYNDWLTPMIGFRWLELREQYLVSGTESPLPVPYQHSVNANNQLYGCQLGVDAELWGHPGSRFRVEGILKAGLFYNGASQQSAFDDGGGTIYTPNGPVSASARKDCAAFFGEIGLNAVYQVSPHFALRGGYRLLAADGVALAPQQIFATGLLNIQAAGVNVKEDLLMHGVNAGVEVTW
ncbi:MAG: hypothetical protein ABSG68_13995 [Thermoguttaceae bacterium]|jgi:hypothetical protein